MNEASPQLGFGASVIAFIAIVAYGVAQIMQVLNIVSYPLADILIYGTSLCISVPFLITILALHDTVESRQRSLGMRRAAHWGHVRDLCGARVRSAAQCRHSKIDGKPFRHRFGRRATNLVLGH